MDDLDLLRYLRDDLSPASPPPDRLHARVESALRADGARPFRATSHDLVPRRGMRWTAIGAAAAAVLVVGGVTAVAWSPWSTDRTPAPPASPSSTRPSRPVAEAQAFLLTAAEAARADPSAAPGPTSYAYRRFRVETWDVFQEPGETAWRRTPQKYTAEAWIPVDLRREAAFTPPREPGLLQVGAACAVGRTTGARCQVVGSPPRPTATEAFLTPLPTDPTEALRRIAREWSPEEPVQVLQNAYRLLANHALGPQDRAMVYEALAQLDGLTLEVGVRTPSGRSVTAVTSSRAGSETVQLLVTPDGRELLGQRTIDLTGVDPMPVGTVSEVEEILEAATVPAVKVRPDGSRWTGPVRDMG